MPEWSPVWWVVVVSVLSFVGALLGAVNLWAQLLDRRVRLRVRWTQGVFYNTGDAHEGRRHIGVEVVNLSVFPVTITKVGIMCGGEGLQSMALTADAEGQAWAGPERLEPRAARTVWFAPDLPLRRDLRQVTSVFAETACGSGHHEDASDLARLAGELSEEARRFGF